MYIKNKNIYYGSLFLLFGLFLYISCVDDVIVHPDTSEQSYLSVREAKSFFESNYTLSYSRNASTANDSGRLSPGNFTPLWEKSFAGSNSHVGSVEVPISPEYRYKAIRCDFKNGKAHAYIVDVSQKLIVMKSRHTGRAAQYLLTLIPDKDYYRSHKGNISNNFHHTGEKNGYSGLVVYTHVVTSKIMAVGKYHDGVLASNVFLPSGKKTSESRISVAKALLDGILIPKFKLSASRSFGEEEIEIPGCIFCGQDACGCLVIVDDCQCGNCDLCGYDTTCFWCGMDPCVCDMYCPWCGMDPCECDDNSSGCGYCGDPNCNGECQDSGGNTGDNDGDENIINAKDLFRNSNMTATNWQVINNMLNKIMANCMGNALVDGLYAALDGATLSIQFSDGGGGGFRFDGQTSGITLGMNSVESNVLFHEMWHAYQAYQETQSSFNGSLLNQEIEAHYAQYLYLSSLPEYDGSKWEKGYENTDRLKVIENLNEYLDNKGSLLDGIDNSLLDTFLEFSIVPVFQSTEGYENYQYDASRNTITNFSNIQTLTIECL